MPIVNFQDHYRTAKSHALDAIKNKQNIVMWGSGCNGKTHLMNELYRNQMLSNYVNLTHKRLNNNEILNTHQPFWVECTNIEYALSQLKDYSYVFINMNGFIYPEYTRLRSGKDERC